MSESASLLGYLFLYIVALLIPPAVALYFMYRLARIRRNWIVHTLFFPAMLMLEYTIIFFAFYLSDADKADNPGLGLALLPQILCFLVSFVGYYLLLLVERARLIWSSFARRRGLMNRSN